MNKQGYLSYIVAWPSPLFPHTLSTFSSFSSFLLLFSLFYHLKNHRGAPCPLLVAPPLIKTNATSFSGCQHPTSDIKMERECGSGQKKIPNRWRDIGWKKIILHRTLLRNWNVILCVYLCGLKGIFLAFVRNSSISTYRRMGSVICNPFWNSKTSGPARNEFDKEQKVEKKTKDKLRNKHAED